MPVKEQQEESLSERVVREAVTVGMETPMRETILEAVEESEGGKRGRSRTLPLAGALVGVGAAAGYLLGTRGEELQSKDVSLESMDEPDVVEEVTAGEEGTFGMDEQEQEQGQEQAEDASSSGGRLGRLVIALGLVAAAAVIRKRMQSSEDEEWEPIEEFETSVPSPGSADEEEEGEEEEEAEAESESEDEEEEGEEVEAESEDEEEEEEEEEE